MSINVCVRERAHAREERNVGVEGGEGSLHIEQLICVISQ